MVENLPSLGYMIGDEGSGNALGKKLIRAYFRGDLPDDLSAAFNKRYQIARDELLKRVYSDLEGPGFLAGFTKFLFHHIKHPAMYKLVYDEFGKFFDDIISHYAQSRQLTVNFCGGIAFYYANILRQVGADKGFVVRTIVEDPSAGLTLYHQKRDL